MDQNVLMNLNWNLPFESQKKAIKEIAEISNLSINSLIQPIGKEYWENAAKVLVEVGYPRIEEVIPDLFEWLQDLNWPGATIIMGLLKSMPKDIILEHLEFATEKAINEDDDVWIMNMSTFLTDLNLQEDDFMSKEVYLALASEK